MSERLHSMDIESISLPGAGKSFCEWMLDSALKARGFRVIEQPDQIRNFKRDRKYAKYDASRGSRRFLSTGVVRYQQEGREHFIQSDWIWSIMPITLLARCRQPSAPEEVLGASAQTDGGAGVFSRCLRFPRKKQGSEF